MEQTRIMVAIVLSFLVLLLWQKFFVQNKTSAPETAENNVVQQVEPQEGARQGQEAHTPEAATPSETEPSTMVAQESSEPARAPEMITIDTGLYTAIISEKGAVLKSFKLKKYHETVEKDSDLKELIDPANTAGTLLNGFAGRSVPGIVEAVYTVQTESNNILVQDKAETVAFQWRSKNGVVIEKSYVFHPETYMIDIHVTVDNHSGNTIRDQMILSTLDTVSGKASRLGFTGPSAMVDGKVEELKIKKITGQNRFNGNITWTAYQDRYFMSAIIPSKPANTSVEFVLKGQTLLESRVMMPEAEIVQGAKAQYSFQAYFGPKNLSILKSMGHQLEKVVDFGWFDWLARPCLLIMNLLYRIIPNYGVAIILLTLLIKAVLWPLGNKSYKSMSQMKKMQPLMAEIRERYKDDKQKMNMELMSLYKTYKVNPLGGCLPMFVQLPVLFALYRMLYQAVELRHEPFIGYINDLSAPERLFHFGFHIPLMQPPTGIPVLTILMGVTMYIQQKMQPPMGDASQAKMMMFMPIFLVVICMNLSSGLVLYWFVSNIISILQQYYVTKKTT